MLKVLLLGDCGSSHIRKWATGLADKNVEIGIFSIGSSKSWWANNPNIKVFNDHGLKISSNSIVSKITYLKLLPALKRAIKSFKPDIVHAHYASSYGLLGALSGFHPFILSVWGSDVFSFPKKSFISKKILQFNFRSADRILSTSHVMAEEISKYTNKEVLVTPFGVDINKFRPSKNGDKNETIIGIIKSLENEYGIEYLIQAFQILLDKHPSEKLKLMIVGDGSKKNFLVELCDKLNVSKHVSFEGYVDPSGIPDFCNKMTIAVYPSLQESFGVSVIEACACEVPVVVSDVGGLPEVIENGISGLVVPVKDIEALANAISFLITHKEEAKVMGRKGRERVITHYNWDENLNQMLDIYNLVHGK